MLFICAWLIGGVGNFRFTVQILYPKDMTVIESGNNFTGSL